MRDYEEQRVALECLRLAINYNGGMHVAPIDDAERFYAFVTGGDADDAKAKLAAVREAVT